MEKLLRPYGIVLDGELQLGLEAIFVGGELVRMRPHTGVPDDYVLSQAFVNAHSHLEYRGLLGKLDAGDYWPWIRQITLAKAEQQPSEVESDCLRAAQENRATGVAMIGEHSDRPGASRAIRAEGMHGVLFMEMITRFQPQRRAQVVKDAQERAERDVLPAYPSPHAFQTVDEETLRQVGAGARPFSMHVAETDLENELCRSGTGAIGDTFRERDIPFQPTGKRLIPTLLDLGLLRPGAQFVHCCAVSQSDIELLATHGVTVAHCPRSNHRLNCPPAPVREMLRVGILVGLGLDSAASSGPIDMFAEMRAALATSVARGQPLSGEEVWRMATTMGRDSLVPAVGRTPDLPWIRINIPSARWISDLIEGASPEHVEWV